ncbi:MAG: ABC transporter ATP-binding protein [Candidatus Heimdallarchaeota archaeon]
MIEPNNEIKDEFTIQIKNLTKFYGAVRGIENLSLKIRNGEIFGFLGQNGSGKTTTIRCMMSILLMDSGEVVIDGEIINRKNYKVREKIGYIPGEVILPDIYTVEEFLNYVQSMRNGSASKRDELTKRFNLPLKRKLGELSKGNKQKVGIIAALMHDPKILILDEPSAGLDPLLQQELYAILLEEKKQDKTIFFSSHNLDEVQRICDRVGIIKDGQLISIEDIEDLNKDLPRTLEVRLRNPDEAILASFGDNLLESTEGITRFLVKQTDAIDSILGRLIPMGLDELSFPPASLEEYFLKYYEYKGNN